MVDSGVSVHDFPVTGADMPIYSDVFAVCVGCDWAVWGAPGNRDDGGSSVEMPSVSSRRGRSCQVIASVTGKELDVIYG